MKDLEILEGNKLIADYIHEQFHPSKRYDLSYDLLMPIVFKIEREVENPNKIGYFAWSVPVINFKNKEEKIISISSYVPKKDASISDRRNSLWNCCVKFLKCKKEKEC